MRIKLGDFRAAPGKLGVVGVSESCFRTIMSQSVEEKGTGQGRGPQPQGKPFCFVSSTERLSVCSLMGQEQDQRGLGLDRRHPVQLLAGAGSGCGPLAANFMERALILSCFEIKSALQPFPPRPGPLLVPEGGPPALTGSGTHRGCPERSSGLREPGEPGLLRPHSPPGCPCREGKRLTSGTNAC